MNVEMSDKIRSSIATIPAIGKLLYRLARDPRVPSRNRMILMGAAAYLLLPFDIVPDWIPGLGRVDDIVLAIFALDLMVNHVPDHIVYEHWEGSPEMLSKIQKGLSMASVFIPENLKRAVSDEEEDLVEFS